MTARADQQAQAEVSQLGARLRDLRAERGWTQDELARRAGLSKSYLSRLEDGERQPSLASLLSLAQAHGLPLAALFAAPAAGPEERHGEDRHGEDRRGEDRRCVVLRAGALPPRQGNGLTYAPLSRPAWAARMQPIRVTVPARREDGGMSRHDGEEWLFVLSGTLRLALEDESYTLCPGDSAHFDARLPHRLSSLDGYDAELILVACAAS